jgi:hypothetical protein
MSADEVGDIRDKLSSNGERLARIEERLATLSGMVEKSLSSFGDLANRVTALEHLRTRILVLAGLIGAGFSLAWDFIRERLTGGT